MELLKVRGHLKFEDGWRSFLRQLLDASGGPLAGGTLTLTGCLNAKRAYPNQLLCCGPTPKAPALRPGQILDAVRPVPILGLTPEIHHQAHLLAVGGGAD